MVNINKHLLNKGGLFAFVITLDDGKKFSFYQDSKNYKMIKIKMENCIVDLIVKDLASRPIDYISVLPDVFRIEEDDSVQGVQHCHTQFFEMADRLGCPGYKNF
jgi:hypothetical protein